MKIEDYRELWNDRAPFFDFDYRDYDADFEFFERYVSSDITLLELGSGTGRLPLHLASEADRADGLDLSPEMVKQARENARRVDDVSFYEGSMSEFEIDEKYDLIINQGNSFLMMDDEHKRRTLECVHRHLTSDGTFVVQIANPERWKRNPQGPILHLHSVSENNKHVVVSYTQDIDEEEQVNHMIWFREAIDEDTGEVRKRVWPIDFQYLTYDGAISMIEEAGFRISAEFGDFDASPLAEDPNKLIFECTLA